MGLCAAVAAGSSDDVGDQQIFELNDAVLERQFALLEPLDQHAVAEMGLRQRVDGGVEIGVFLAFGGQLKAEIRFLFLGQRQHVRGCFRAPGSHTWLTDRRWICTEFSSDQSRESTSREFFVTIDSSTECLKE